jgi:hypothetical protein
MMGGAERRGMARVERRGGRCPIVWGDDWNDKKKAQLGGPIRNHPKLVDMLKILEPFWNRALLGCYEAPLKKGSRISLIPKNGINPNGDHRIH